MSGNQVKTEPTEEMLTSDSDVEELGEDSSDDDWLPVQNSSDGPGPDRRMSEDENVSMNFGDLLLDEVDDDGESDYSDDSCSLASEESDLQEDCWVDVKGMEGVRKKISLEEKLLYAQDFVSSIEKTSTHLPESSSFLATVGIKNIKTFKWEKTPTGSTKPKPDLHKIVPSLNLPGPLTKPIDAVMLFLRPIIHIIVMYTNIEGERRYTASHDRAWTPVDETEILAFIGLLILAGALGSAMELKEILWSFWYGPAIFRATMSLRRFKEIQTFMRFDDRSTRDKNDIFSPFREMWTIFDNHLGQYYIPGENLTVGEQFVPYKGLCKFKQCLPVNLEKSYIKFWWLCDSKSFYPLRGIPYLGKQDKMKMPPNLSTQVVMTLIESYKGSYRNVACGNYFTDLLLTNKLSSENLSLVGALRQNSFFVPSEFNPNINRQVKSSLFGFLENKTLVSYVPSKGTAMILMSTKHPTGEINASTGKPEVLESYDETKGGVKTFVRRLRKHSCRQKTRRWPMVCFYNLVDVSCFAAYVIWNMEHPDWNLGKSDHRISFLMEVGDELVQPNIVRRLETCRHEDTLWTIKQVLGSLNKKGKGKPKASAAVGGRDAPQGPEGRRRRCHFCPSKSSLKSKQVCSTCSMPVCKQHSHVTSICSECL